MPEAIRFTLSALSLTFVAVGVYHRVQSLRSGERLDRTREGWAILIAIRLLGLLTVGSTAALLWKPAWFEWASLPMPVGVRWIGVAGFACAVAWLIWMFRTLGLNLTDTVVVRRDGHFVDHGPYRFVRNPMYTGVLMMGMTLGLALGTWLVPIVASLMLGAFTVEKVFRTSNLSFRRWDRRKGLRLCFHFGL